MAIDRTAFNAALESDGSPNSGDVIGKAQLAAWILDPVDAALLTVGGGSLGASTELTIATDAVTVTGKHHSVDTEADAGTDNLATLTAGAGVTDGHLLVLKPENVARVVTVKDGTGNILLRGGDFVLNDAEHRLLVIKDGANWYELARNSAGAGIGDVVGPGSSVDDRIATFDGTTGKLIQDGGSTIVGVIAAAVAAGPAAHKTSHENGGTDEISVAGLSGLLADGQTPLAHKTSHQAGGSDAIKLDDLASPDDNTDLNASTSAHGLLPKLGGGTTNYLRADGTWAAPAGGGGGSMPAVEFTATANRPPSSSYATPDYRNGHPVLDFDASLDEAAIFEDRLPRTYTGNGLTVSLEWMASSATSGNVVWGLSMERHDTGTDLDADSYATEVTAGVACSATSGAPTYTEIALTSGAQMDSLALGESFRLRVRRLGTNGSDTMTGDAELKSVTVRET
jgi:hypothetical protein